uniref:Uncharacterized protein n=1 Tax=Anguilla anguilla TaxID=7936 RepID=A0A0E9RMH3_ANGAN
MQKKHLVCVCNSCVLSSGWNSAQHFPHLIFSLVSLVFSRFCQIEFMNILIVINDN